MSFLELWLRSFLIFLNLKKNCLPAKTLSSVLYIPPTHKCFPWSFDKTQEQQCVFSKTVCGEYGIVRANHSSEPVFQEQSLYLQSMRNILKIGALHL